MNRYTGGSFRRFLEEDMSEDSNFKFDYYGNNRHICDVLADMRRCEESKNYSALKGLIEEAQIMAYRMESGLRDQKDLIKIQQSYAEARKAYKKLRKEYTDLEKKVKPKKVKSEEK